MPIVPIGMGGYASYVGYLLVFAIAIAIPLIIFLVGTIMSLMINYVMALTLGYVSAIASIQMRLKIDLALKTMNY